MLWRRRVNEKVERERSKDSGQRSAALAAEPPLLLGATASQGGQRGTRGTQEACALAFLLVASAAQMS